MERAAGAVGRPDLQIVGHLLKALHRLELTPGARFGRAHHPGGGFQQVGAADIADKEEITGKDPHGLVGASRVGDHEGDVFRCVAGGVQYIYLDIANHPAIAILNQYHIRLMGILIFPVGVAHIAQVDGGPGGGG